MSSLEAIPMELLDHIVKDVPWAYRHSLVLTCRHLHKSATPALYETIVIDTFHTFDDNKKDISRATFRNFVHRKNVKSLLRTVLERPDYAKYIKTFQVRYPKSVYYRDDISQYETLLFVKAINSLSLPRSDQKDWCFYANPEGHNFTAILPLLIT